MCVHMYLLVAQECVIMSVLTYCIYVKLYGNNSYEKNCRHENMYSMYILFSSTERTLDIERARAKEIATGPPPKQEIDMVCVCTYICM